MSLSQQKLKKDLGEKLKELRVQQLFSLYSASSHQVCLKKR